MTTEEEKHVQRYRKFCDAMGAASGLFWAGIGISLADSQRLHATAFGQRLEKYDEHGELEFFAAAGCMWMRGEEFGTRLAMGSIPSPDRTEKSFQYWRTATLAAWAAAGCPGRSGREQPELAAQIGAAGPAPVRELSNEERVAAGIKMPGR